MEDTDDPDFGLSTHQASVAAAEVSCLQCDAKMDVVCLYCESGMDLVTGESIEQFVVSNIWAVDEALSKELRRWPNFVQHLTDEQDGIFENHCPECAAVQEDYLLHDEPGDVFFGLSRVPAGSIRFTSLQGEFRLSGDYSFRA